MVEIIPKPIKKIPAWHNLALFLSLALLIAVILGYAILFYFEKKATNNFGDLEEKIFRVGTKEEKVLEAKVLTDRKKINDFSAIFQNHKKSSNFFRFLEGISHPQVWFSELELNPDKAQALISGKTLNFQTLGEQLYIFQEQDLIQSISLSHLSIGEEGETEFSFQLSLNPQIFQ